VKKTQNYHDLFHEIVDLIMSGCEEGTLNFEEMETSVKLFMALESKTMHMFCNEMEGLCKAESHHKVDLIKFMERYETKKPEGMPSGLYWKLKGEFADAMQKSENAQVWAVIPEDLVELFDEDIVTAPSGGAPKEKIDFSGVEKMFADAGINISEEDLGNPPSDCSS
jgi:hypothetical protein